MNSPSPTSASLVWGRCCFWCGGPMPEAWCGDFQLAPTPPYDPYCSAQCAIDAENDSREDEETA